MSEAMTDTDESNETNGANDTARTTVEVDRHVWRQVRAEAVGEGKNVSEKLEEILRGYFDIYEEDTEHDT
jgi:hypothetical protein